MMDLTHVLLCVFQRERFRICDLNLVDLVHFKLQSPPHIECCPQGLEMACEQPKAAPDDRAERKVLLIAHGYSPQVGPDYPLIRR